MLQSRKRYNIQVTPSKSEIKIIRFLFDTLKWKQMKATKFAWHTRPFSKKKKKIVIRTPCVYKIYIRSINSTSKSGVGGGPISYTQYVAGRRPVRNLLIEQLKHSSVIKFRRFHVNSHLPGRFIFISWINIRRDLRPFRRFKLDQRKRTV